MYEDDDNNIRIPVDLMEGRTGDSLRDEAAESEEPEAGQVNAHGQAYVGYGQSAYGQEQAHSGYGQPSYGQNQAHSEPGQSAYRHGQAYSGYGQSAYGQGQPHSGYGQPAFGQGQPHSGYGQPVFGQGQPHSGYGQPAFGQGQPYYGFYSAAYAQPGADYYGYNPSGVRGKKKGMKNWQKGLIIFIIIMVAIIIFGIIYGAGRSSSFVSMGPYIARINVEGTISSAPSVDVFGNVAGYYHQWTLDKLDELMSDGNNKGIIFYIDTPGGGVYESDELYLRIKEYQEVTENPVYVAMGSMAASGGYYVAAPADKIFANRNTWTGSIGVTMGTMVDVSEFLGEHGVKTETFISGRNKAMGNYFDPMTDEQRNIYQALVDEAYDQFTGIVADEREFTDFKVRELADGRIYTAKQALELGLIDEIGTYDDAVADLKDTFGLENCAVTEFYYSNSSFISRVLGEDNMQQILAVLRYGKGDVGAILQFAGDMNRMPIRYMYGN